MKKYRGSRPYLKCNLKFEWHIESHETSSLFLETLAEFLKKKGFKRPGKIIKRNYGFRSCDMEKTKGSDIPKEESMDKANSETTRKSLLALIGMRSVLRNMERNVLSAVFFDTDTIKPSSVATTLGLYATSLQNTKVYAIPGLNSTLSTALNMPMVGTVGLMNVPATKELYELATHSFNNVSVSNKQTSLPTAVTTELQTTTGKRRNKKKKR